MKDRVEDKDRLQGRANKVAGRDAAHRRVQNLLTGRWSVPYCIYTPYPGGFTAKTKTKERNVDDPRFFRLGAGGGRFGDT